MHVKIVFYDDLKTLNLKLKLPTEFRNDESSESEVDLCIPEGRSSVTRVVDEIGHECSEAPVVRAVLKQKD